MIQKIPSLGEHYSYLNRNGGYSKRVMAWLGSDVHRRASHAGSQPEAIIGHNGQFMEASPRHLLIDFYIGAWLDSVIWGAQVEL